MGRFAASVKMNVIRLQADVNRKVYKIARELFTKIVNFTPSPTNPGVYAAGHLANQWYPESGDYFSEELSSDTSPTGSGSLARIQSLSGVEFYQQDGKLTLTNNLSYAYRAEVLGWPAPEWSGKSGADGQGGPYRMVRRSIQAIAAKYG